MLQLWALIVTKSMSFFSTILNLFDLQNFIVLLFEGIAVGYSESTILVFCHATATINPVAIATFFIKSVEVF